ncbi:MAG: translation initiation factor IF-6 [Candidatus Aenigmatarchaeota archaeon]
MIVLEDYLGDVNIGFYGIATDRFFLSSFEKDFSQILKVPTFKFFIGDSELVGLFNAANSNGIVLPKIVKEEEIKKIKKIGIEVIIIKEKYTALGNLIVANDKGAIVSELISKKSLKKIEECLGVEVYQTKIANIKLVGSVCFATNKGAIIHRDASEEDLKIVKEILKVDVEKASVNLGSPFVKSGIIANSYGALVGSKTSGYELDIIARSLKLSIK